jgi:hypothetical protein
MEEAGTLPQLMDERLGHEDGSVQARYSHVTPRMRARLMDALTEQWEEALEVRRQMSPGSPVAALDTLLRPLAESGPGRVGHGERRARSSAGFVAGLKGADQARLPLEPQPQSLSPLSLRRPNRSGTAS